MPTTSDEEAVSARTQKNHQQGGAVEIEEPVKSFRPKFTVPQPPSRHIQGIARAVGGSRPGVEKGFASHVTLPELMQTDFPEIIDNAPKRVLWKLSTCEDFFDRDHDTLVVEVENQTLKFAWDIAAPDATQKEIRVWRNAALATRQNRPLPGISEDEVYRLVLPNRDLRSTELQRIFSCSHPHITTLRSLLVVTREPLQADGPNAFTVFSRASIISFLRSRRLS